MADSVVSAKLEVVASQFISGMAAAGSAAGKFASDTTKAFGQVSAAAVPAAKSVGTLEQSFRQFKSAQVGQGRMVGWYVRELTEFTGASQEAKIAMGGLGSVLAEVASGGPTKLIMLVAAFEAVKTVVQLLSSAMERAKKIADETEKALEGVARRIAQIGRAPIELKIIDAAALRDALDAFDEINAKLGESGEGGTGSALDREWEARRAALNKAAQAAGLPAGANDAAIREMLRRMLSEIDAMESAARTQRALKEAEAQEEQRRAQLGLANKTLNDIEKEEDKARKKRIQAEKDALEQIRLAGIEARSKGGGKLEPYSMGYDPETAMEEQAQTAAGTAASAAAQAQVNAMEAAKKRAEENAKLAKISQEAWETAGTAMANAFSGIGAAIGGAAGTVLKVLGQMLSAAVAVAVAMAAALPAPFGTINMIATAAAMVATIASTIAQATAATGREFGGPVIRGKAYLVGERGPELFRPNSSGDIIPNRALATAGGPTINLNITAMDGKSVYRVLTDAQGEVVRFLRETVRDGRW